MIKKRLGQVEAQKKKGVEEEFRYKENRVNEEYDRAIQVSRIPMSPRGRVLKQIWCKVSIYLKEAQHTKACFNDTFNQTLRILIINFCKLKRSKFVGFSLKWHQKRIKWQMGYFIKMERSDRTLFGLRLMAKGTWNNLSFSIILSFNLLVTLSMFVSIIWSICHQSCSIMYAIILALWALLCHCWESCSIFVIFLCFSILTKD